MVDSLRVGYTITTDALDTPYSAYSEWFFFMDLVCPCDCTSMGFHVVMVVFLRCNGPSK